MRNVLVTGSNGQLGQEIKDISGEFSNFTFMFHDVDTLNITSSESIDKFAKENKIDCIINCAAYTNVDKAEEEFNTAMLVNAEALNNIVSLAKRKNAYLIHISTDYVFDGSKPKPYTEADKTTPNSAYGKSKLEGEKIVDEYDKSIIIRTSWLYSSYGNNFVKTMLRLGSEKEQIGVVFDQVGSPTYAKDLALAVLKIIEFSSEKGTFPAGIYHYSNEGVCSWYDFAIEIMKLKQLKCKVKPIETHEYPLPANRPPYSVFNKNKIKRTFNILIPHWKESLENCIEKIK